MGKISSLESICKSIRKDILTISYNAHIGHIGSALSVVEILVALYFKTLKTDPEDPLNENRDRFILSKGHAAAALFSVLYRKGYFPEKVLNTFCKDGGKLMVHPEWNGLPGIEHGTGSLGHGLPVGVGMAYAAKILKQDYKVFVLISDSEIEEGSVWEAALFAGHHKLDNLVVILDYNGSQAMGKVSEILNIEPIGKKWESFNFEADIVDGHNINQLTKSLAQIKENKPKIIIAKTVMGKGISFMQNDFRWHYYDLKNDQFVAAMKELGGK